MNRFIGKSHVTLNWSTFRTYIVLTLVMVALSACSTQKQPIVGEKTVEPGPPRILRIGFSPIYPPLAFQEKGELKGVEADFAKLLDWELGVKTVLVKTEWDELIPALLDGKVDMIMSGMSVTEERSQQVRFADPYLRIGQMALVRKKDLSKLRDPSAMDQKGVRVGFQNQTTGEFFVREHLKKVKLVGFDSIDEAVTGLRKNKIDFFIHDAPTIWRLTDRQGSKTADFAGLYRPLTEEYLAWAVPFDDLELQEQLNAVVKKWTDSGKIQVVLDKWIRVRKVTVSVGPIDE